MLVEVIWYGKALAKASNGGQEIKPERRPELSSDQRIDASSESKKE